MTKPELQAWLDKAWDSQTHTLDLRNFPFGPIPHWIKCTDEPAPKTKKVLALDQDGDMAVVWHNSLGFVRGYSGDTLGGDYDYFEPIAWMPLPDPPD